jgi:hypothetical protein
MLTDEIQRESHEEPEKIITSDPKEVRKWCLKFNVSPSELKKAVREAGPEVNKVERYFTAKRFSRSLR